jgi:hypothetical protein
LCLELLTMKKLLPIIVLLISFSALFAQEIIQRVELYSASGVKMLESVNNTINTITLANGIYLVCVETKVGTKNTSIVQILH